jgi:RHS repeat-associated protein
LLTNSTWSGAVTGTVSRSYNADLRLASQTINGTNSVSFAYDGDELITNAGPLRVVRDTNGMAVAATVGAFTETWRYNEFGEMTNITATFSNSVMFSAAYLRDPLGRVTNQSETVGGTTHTADFHYDLAGRLDTVQRDAAPAAAYQYDSNGNRVQGPQPGETASYDAQDRLVASTFAGNNYSYSFTPAGDLAAKTNGVQTTLYSYDALRHLTKFIAPDGTTVDYLFDGLGRRVARKVNSTLTQGLLYHDAQHVVAQLDGSGHVTGQFLYASGRSAAPDVMLQGGVTFALVRDQLGSVRLVINSQTGEVVQRIEYDEFGRVLTDTNPGFQPFRFAGGLYDPVSGLVHNMTRDFDSEAGRWTVRDPAGFAGGSANLYAYVGNDPVNLIDPSGTGPVSPPAPNTQTITLTIPGVIPPTQINSVSIGPPTPTIGNSQNTTASVSSTTVLTVSKNQDQSSPQTL